MEKIIHRAEERGVSEHGWLSSRFSFSFADWYEPTRMGFGALRVINDDVIAPSSGFGAHSHRDMEIITIVTSGTVTHKDSIGNIGTVPAGDVQVMSAGTGVVHSEYNDSATEPLTLFQIWIEPNEKAVTPRYDQRSFLSSIEGVTELVGPFGTEGLTIRQDAYISRAKLASGTVLDYKIHKEGSCVYVFVVSGSIVVEEETLVERDAIGLSDFSTVSLACIAEAVILIIEVSEEHS
jgi:redox-sensitive bicupin YhaK (pirin superfamily)